jgi:hypothetical protein
MGKKTAFIALALIMALAGAVVLASAAQNVANTSQKGSLLIFPKIDTSAIGQSGFYRDTIVRISNDYYQDVWVKCYWVNAAQEIQDFMFRLTPNQPVWFRASDGTGTGYYDHVQSPIIVPPFFEGEGVVGELKCWAVDAQGVNQISFNHLYGKALIFDPVQAATFEYNPWSFTARSVPLGQPVGTSGTLVLSGATGGYDACPQMLLFDFFAKGTSINLPKDGGFATFVNTDLTLVPCIQDLRQDRVPTCTKAKFDIWNENETKYTGAYQCLKCWFEGYLGDIGLTTYGGVGGEKFWYKNLHSTAGRFRVEGVSSTVCNGVFPTCRQQVVSPLLGLISTEIKFTSDPFDSLAGGTPSTAGTGASVTIQWDPQGGTPESPAR